jgi:DNA-binding MarR family transcriptional regulator
MVGVSNGLQAEDGGTDGVEMGPLPVTLGHLLRRATGRAFADFAEALGEDVSPAEFGLLTVVAHNPGITQVRIAAALGLDKSTVSPALARLTRRGLLRRERLARDGRLQALRLAPGAEAAFAALRARVEAHEARIAAALTPAERNELIRLLKRVAVAPATTTPVAPTPVDGPDPQEVAARVDAAPPAP